MYAVLAIVFTCIILGSIGQILLKKGLNAVGGIEASELISTKLFTVLFNPLVFLGLVFYGVSMILWLVALSKHDVSAIYPLVSFGYVLTAIFAMIFLKEVVTINKWMGIFLVVMGAFLILKK